MSESSLRRNNSAQRMTPGQHNSAMIYLRLWRPGRNFHAGPLNQRPAAGRTPIRDGLFGKHRPAMAANPFHSQILPDWSCIAPNRSPTTGGLAGQIYLNFLAENRSAICILCLGPIVGSDRN